MRSQYAYRQLFLHFHKPLTRFALTILPSKEEADEVFQDVMLKIWDMGKELADIRDLKTYLLTLTKNASLNYLSKYHKATLTEFSESISDDLQHTIDPEQVLLYSELRDLIEETVRNMPPQCKMVYHLVREKGLTYKEVARVMGISIKTAERHITLALRRIALAVQAYRQTPQNKN